MKKTTAVKYALLIAVASTLASGCVVRERVVYRQGPPPPPAAVGGEVVVDEAPPAPLVEVVPAGPGPGFIWIGGSWVWRGHWVWEAGRWGRPPHPGAVWVSHRYVYRNGVHVWVRGGWRY